MTLFLRTLRYITPYWPQVMLGMACVAVYSALNAASIWLLGPFLATLFGDGQATSGAPLSPGGLGALVEFKLWLKAQTAELMAGDSPGATLGRLCVAIALVFFVKNAFNYARYALMAGVEQKVSRDLRNALYRHFHDLPLGFFHRSRTGALISRVTHDVIYVNDALNASLISLVADPIAIVSFLGIMVVLSWKLTLLVAVVFPLSVIVVGRTSASLRRYSRRAQELMADLTQLLGERLAGVRVVKAFGMEAYEVEKFGEETQRVARSLTKLTRVRRLAPLLTESVVVVVGAGIAWFGGSQVLREEALAPEEFLVFLGSMFMLMRPLKSLGQVHNRIQIGLAAAGRLFEILDIPSSIVGGGARLLGPGPREGIRLEDVWVSYDGEPPVVRGVSLEIGVGEVVALIGPSGAGKSSLVDLLPRFIDPLRGRVLIDDTNVRTLELGELRSLFGIVAQEVILFNDTVRSNIAYGLSGVDQEQIEAAAHTANAHDFIADLPAGYDTVIGDRGLRLSGGQRQRLAIARAILRNPPILIFDEATSSLDTESETLVQEAIAHLFAGRTTIVVAHRLSTIRSASRIVVVDEGRIIDQGRHEELLTRGGLYAKLYAMQFRDEPLALRQ